MKDPLDEKIDRAFDKFYISQKKEAVKRLILETTKCPGCGNSTGGYCADCERRLQS